MSGAVQSVTQALREELSKVVPKAACCAAVELETLLAAAGQRRSAARCGDASTTLRRPMLARRALALLRGGCESRVEVRREPPGPRKAAPATDTFVFWTGSPGGSWAVGRGDEPPTPGCPGRPQGEPPPTAGVALGKVLASAGRRRCCLTAHLRALTLARGHLGNPRRCYHVEVVLPADYPVDRLLAASASHGLGLLATVRRGRPVLYLKGREAIADYLGRIGAVGVLLAFEESVIERTMREDVNRAVNCEVSNLKRVSRAAAQQLAAIKLLKERHQLELLSPRLREVARLRLAHPADDLTTLARRTEGTLGRSGVFHRLRELVELARAEGGGHKDGSTRTRKR